MNIKGTFTVSSWDESSQHELSDDSKITRASVKQTYSGGMSGESSIEYTMYYPGKASATFIGIEYFNGAIAGKSGQIVLEHKGTFENGVARSEFVAIGGTDGLQDFPCKGRFTTINHGQADYEIVTD